MGKRLRWSQRGVSLVELMVAMLISTMLMAGAVTVFVNTKHSYQLQNDMAYLQENARFALGLVGRDLLMADHWGGVGAGDVSVLASVAPAFTAAGSCTDAWFSDVSESVRGFEGGASSPLPGCIADADYVAGTDVLLVRYASAAELVADADLDSAAEGNDTRFFVRSQAGGRAVVFVGSDEANARAELPPGAGTFNHPYTVAVYFVRPCQSKAGAVCAASDDGGNPIPTLVRMEVRSGALVQEPVADSIEQLQLLYGMNRDADADVEEFVGAGGVGAGEWDDVVAVQADLLARGRARDPNVGSAASYSLANGAVTYAPAADTLHYRRQMVSRVLQVRNRSRQ